MGGEKRGAGIDAGNRELPVARSTACVNDWEQESRATRFIQNEYISITRWLKKLLRKMNYSPDMNMNEIQTVQFSVINRDLHEISKLLDSKNPIDVQNIEDIFDRNAQFHILLPETRSLTGDLFHFIKDNFVIVSTVLVCLVSLWYLHSLFRNGLSLKLVIIVVCLASVTWTWIHMYQKEVAKKHSMLDSLGYPEECQVNSLSFLSSVRLFWQKKLFDLDDNCAKYYEALIVDPFWKIGPHMVISETVSNFVLQPMGAIANHCNTFIKNLFSGMPLIMVIPIMVFAFLILLMLFRYRLRLPFFFASLEPTTPVSNTNRVEFLPFSNSDEREMVCDTSSAGVQPSAHTSKPCALQDSKKLCVNESGDSMQETSFDDTKNNLVVKSLSDMCTLSTPADHDHFSDAERKFNACGDMLSNTPNLSQVGSHSPSEMASEDHSQTNKH